MSVYMSIMREYKQQFHEIDNMELELLLTVLVTRAKLENAEIIHDLSELNF